MFFRYFVIIVVFICVLIFNKCIVMLSGANRVWVFYSQNQTENASSRVLFFHLVLRSYDYNMHVEGLLPADLCLVAF